ncbi:transcription-repair coupling factor [Pseudoalteromonas luteoviolacea]|uniref:Transcription-repair-coupling factor n=1 Tax=Pseudoalteromonas luteoviolacea S4054 TaxID=1129367 RepID=A0A0F6ADS7_9GAMM|nr:transcription-repair coupling factor [Pseudoalteromonas luteoviolacea]AOT08361.1 transcription-repair coupling factor [Pseudoalteromonas luteoviolacea]AOT13277.1 transcription-repair coupling factor [Pseudoalteromonas luteoviolacea]AOT18190.1 transcription-repair coupling factor [Pseudoalteromonas luteoviolacea]KKE84308.1 transcription-repair coupling factor [Pseudoalteromonas luteoviolacea S4054]KZN76087.1 transcription-repair coupling factor [Pseudoalteromonas luteoviolacea S4047-1]
MALVQWNELPWVKSAKDKIHWGQLLGSSLAITISEGVKNNQPLVVLVTPDTPSALRLETELGYLLGEDNVMVFPDWETLPYDHFSPHQDIISQRLASLNALRTKQQGVLLIPVATLMLRTAPPEFIYGNALQFKVGDTLDAQGLKETLTQAGYRNVQQVMEHGEFAVRGSIIDLYPMGSQHPYRLDFFDDELDSIRLFDIETQRSSETIKSIDLLPAHEFPTNDSDIERFRIQYRETFGASSEQDSIYMQVTRGNWPAGIEYYLPLFYDKLATIFDYLPNDAIFMHLGDIEHAASDFWSDVSKRYENRRVDPLRPLLEPKELYLNVESLFEAFSHYPRIRLSQASLGTKAGHSNVNAALIDDVRIDHKQADPYSAIVSYITEQKQQKGKVLFSVESDGRRESLLTLLKPTGLKLKEFESFEAFTKSRTDVGLVVSPLEASVFLDGSKPLSLITEQELLGIKVSQRRRRKHKYEQGQDALIRNLAELKEGQPIVHLDHGVGRYLGLQTIDAAGVATEFVTIIYSGDAKLYVPVSSLHMLSRYSGGEEASAPLHKLGSDVWEKAKRKAAEKVRDVAAELLDIYAKRQSKPGHQFNLDGGAYRDFSNSFPFEETDDQRNAIEAVIGDMQTNQAMDRLVCGDVGFGKTEVAMRAAFVAINDNKQVAVLVPTTLLAQQHFENFKDRFADLPIEVGVLSRFNSTKEQKQTLTALEDGKIDIVIGTHKLIQENIKFKDLGLLIVDEEHRFGVRQKEKIKKLRADVDILTLTATPIPRTLNMAMSGMRDLSIIATPPAKRLAVKTFVRERNDELIREAILREIKRGGQVYFLHNNVETIEKTAADISALVPEANIAVAHGQMRERELEHLMSDFYHQKHNVLVCTTIIETGIDIPTANTIIMDRADKLGLAQLHQLRGRVGRSHHQAYAYLLTRNSQSLTKDAVKRLQAIESLEDLGAGFALATHDLEIRGAGELLGDDQSGQIQTVGFTLYMEMLEQAVQALKDGKEPTLENLLQQQSEVDLKLPALLPDDYIHDVNTRLSMYKRIATMSSENELDELKVELIDRFGLLPDAAKNIFEIQLLKCKAQQIGVQKIEANPKGGYFEFSNNTSVNPTFIIGLIQSNPAIYRMEGASKLRFNIEEKNGQERLKLINAMMDDFQKKAVA